MATTMLRPAASRHILRSLSKPSTFNARCASTSIARSAFRTESFLSRHSKPLAVSTFRQPTALVRYASDNPHISAQEAKREKEFGQEKLEPHPEIVSSTSSVHPIAGEVGVKEQEDETDMMAGMRHDLKVIKETFNLREVPKEAYNIGLAGVLPYLATSTATVACAFEYNAAAHSGSGMGIFLSEHTAELCLHVLEPLQVGYGAVILSFLGAIHWGLEWAQYGGHGGYKRYAIGVIAPAVAWPTILFPVEYALISQFLAFNILYAVDSSTTRMGWTPPWYGTYRFILTFVVGASIVLSLIGRGQVSDSIQTMPSAAERVKNAAAEGKEKKKQKKKRAAEEE